MAIYNLSDIIENLKDEKEDYEKKLQAWKNFKIVTKKDGTPFSVLSKNFEGASIGKYSIVEDSDHPYLTVNYQTDRTGYHSDHIQIFHFLDELPISDERRKEYKPQFYIRTADLTGSFEFDDDLKIVMPGDTINVVVNLLVRIGLAPGVRFTLREGRLTVGAGIVLEVLN